MKASEPELEKSIESCERWEWFGGGLVVIGVIAEVAIAAIHPPYDSFWEQWGSSVANSLIAIGVALEIKFGQMAGLRQNELKRRSDEKAAVAEARAAEAIQKAAEANARAVQSQLRLQMLWKEVSPRHIEFEPFKKALEGQIPAHVEILYLRDASDAFLLAFQIRALLSESGWTVEPLQPIPEVSSDTPLTVTVGGQPAGITVVAKSIEGGSTSPYAVLMHALGKGLGVGVFACPHPSVPDGMVRIVVGPRP